MRSAGLVFASFSVAVLLAVPALGQGDTTPPTVMTVVPAPDAILSSPPSSVVAAFDEEVDADTVSFDSLRLVRSGGDGTFTDGNEVEIVPTSVTRTGASGDEATMDLAGASMPDDVYEVTVVGGPPPALSFDGTDDSVDCGDILNDLAVPFTLSAWIHKADGDWIGVVSSDDVPRYYGTWFTVNANNTVSIAYGDGTGSGSGERRSKNSASTVPTGVWVHVAAVVRGAVDMTIYIDGSDAGGSYSGSGGAMVHSADRFKVGSQRTNFSSGMIDEVRVWNIERTQAEIQEYMYKPVLPGTPGLAARWSFNEGSGQTVADSSWNGLDGTLGADASAASDDPSWTVPGAPVKSAVADLAGNLLDGDGDTSAGGDFTSMFTITGNAPTVESTSPYDGEPDVDVFSSVSVAFSEPMDRSTVESAFSILPDVPGALSWAGQTMTFHPSSRLYDNTVYTVTITAAASDWAGDPMAGDYVFSFTTTDVLSSGEPLPAGYIGHILHLGTQRQDRILGGDIDADYFAQAGLGSEAVQRPSEGIAVDLSPATTTESPIVWTPHVYDGGNNYWCMNYANDYTMYWAIYVISPSEREAQLHYHVDDDTAAWINGQRIFTEYGPDFGVNREFILPGGISLLLFKFAEHSGDDFVHYSIQHRDGSAMTDLRYTLRDPLMPQIESHWPESDATDVSRWTYALVRFTKPMDVTADPSTVADITGGTATGTWEWMDEKHLVWTPTAALDGLVTYAVAVDPVKARDLAGNCLDGANSFAFTTKAASGTPSVTGVDPSEGETGSAVADVQVSGTDFESGAISRPPAAVPFGGHYYEYLAGPAGWHAARDDCVARGGHLVTISSLDENDFVWGLAPPDWRWIGLSDEGAEGTWEWVTGEPLAYTNWDTNQPDGDGDYAHMWSGGQGGWNDLGSNNLTYVCEYEPAPPEVRLYMSGEVDIVATNVRMADAGTLLADFDLTSAALGDWDVVVTNPDGAWGALPGGFTVLDLHSIVPGPVTGLAAIEASLTRIDLAWVNPTGPGLAGVVLLRRANAAPTFAPTDGTPCTVGVTYGDSECVYDGTVAAFSDSPLTPELTYHHAAYARDGDYTYSAAVVTSARVARPYVETTSPPDQETGVPVGSAIEVSFSESMNTMSAESALSVSGGVTGTKTWAGNTLILTPSQPLGYSTSYAVTVTTGAQDVAGIALADTYAFVFTTLAEGGDDPETPFDGGCAAGGHGSPLVRLSPLVLLAFALARSHRRARREVRTHG